MAKSTDDTNVDLRVPVAVHVESLPWLPSPSATVWRRTLYREGGEFGPVTSVVRYDAASAFAPHSHPGGEEILVLDGVFSDEHGDYPAGTYLLNPPGTSHSPASREGCLLFVRLRQYERAGRFAHEHLPPGARISVAASERSREILVLEGAVESPLGVHPATSWLRFPASPDAVELYSPGGARIFRERD